MIRFDGITIDRKRHRIMHGDRVLQFGQANRRRPHMLFRLACILLLAGPKNKQELCELVYGDDANGGPLYWSRVVDVMVFTLQKRFATIGIELHSIPVPGSRRLGRGSGPRRRYYAEPAMICEQYGEAAE